MAVEDRNHKKRIRQITNYKLAGVALLMAVAGVVALYASNRSALDDHPTWQATLSQMGGLVLATGLLAVLWDLWGRRTFLDEVLEKAKLASDVDAAGIESVTMEWKDVTWEKFFSTARHIEVFIAYGRSWRSNHWENITKFASDEKHSLFMYLPDPQHESTMKILAQRYGYTEEKIRSYVIEAAEAFAKLGEDSKADIRIYYRAGDPTYTCYRFDEQFLVTLYANRRERGGVPTLLLDSKGSFGEFFRRDMEAIRQQSRAVSLNALVQEETTK